MRVVTIVICAAAAVSVCGAYGDTVRIRSDHTQTSINDQSTKRYLAAQRLALIEIKKNMRSIGIAVSRVVQNIEYRCPAVVIGAPRDPSRWPVEVGITETLLVAAAHADARITAKLGQKISRLRWTSPGLIRLVRREVLAADGLAHRKLPELCGDLREWAHSRFRRIPPVLKQFNHEVQLLSEGKDVLSVLRRYESMTERREVEQLGRVVVMELRARILTGRMRIFNQVGLRRSAIAAPTGMVPYLKAPARKL